MKIRQLIYLLLLAASPLLSCKKAIEEERKNAFLAAMTQGHWLIDEYLEGTISIKPEFEGFSFRFYENGSVEARLDAAVYYGTWMGDIANYSIKSTFPQAGDPLKKLNGTWKVTSGTAEYLHAEMSPESGRRILRLKKQ